ncbi:MAG: hypothetical protein CL878_13035 [Dehalococcoidia bacterium]|nr:hypothetical protein [Dehalococcoidia bacterium]
MMRLRLTSLPQRSLLQVTTVVVVALAGMALAANVSGWLAALLVLVLMIVVSAGFDLIARSTVRSRPTWDRFILPNLLVVGAALFLRLVASGGGVAAGLALFGFLLVLVVWAEQHDWRGATDRRWSTLALLVIGYVVVFALYAAIYQTKVRTLFNAPAIVAVTMLIAVRLLRLTDDLQPYLRLAPYAAFAGLVVGEVTWALNYWPLNGLLGGAFLLTVLYFLVQVLSQHLAGRLTPRTLAEHGAISLLAAVLILWRRL